MRRMWFTERVQYLLLELQSKTRENIDRGFSRIEYEEAIKEVEETEKKTGEKYWIKGRLGALRWRVRNSYKARKNKRTLQISNAGQKNGENPKNGEMEPQKGG